jgi:hypothetical protein
MNTTFKGGIIFDTSCYISGCRLLMVREADKPRRPGRGSALATAFDYDKVKDAPQTPYGGSSKTKHVEEPGYFLKAVYSRSGKT